MNNDFNKAGTVVLIHTPGQAGDMGTARECVNGGSANSKENSNMSDINPSSEDDKGPSNNLEGGAADSKGNTGSDADNNSEDQVLNGSSDALVIDPDAEQAPAQQANAPTDGEKTETAEAAIAGAKDDATETTQMVVLRGEAAGEALATKPQLKLPDGVVPVQSFGRRDGILEFFYIFPVKDLYPALDPFNARLLTPGCLIDSAIGYSLINDGQENEILVWWSEENFLAILSGTRRTCASKPDASLRAKVLLGLTPKEALRIVIAANVDQKLFSKRDWSEIALMAAKVGMSAKEVAAANGISLATAYNFLATSSYTAELHAAMKKPKSKVKSAHAKLLDRAYRLDPTFDLSKWIKDIEVNDLTAGDVKEGIKSVVEEGKRKAAQQRVRKAAQKEIDKGNLSKSGAADAVTKLDDKTDK